MANRGIQVAVAALAVLSMSCGVSGRVQKAARQFYSDSLLSGAHVGLVVYDVQKNKTVYARQADKYFVPASNTKIITCFAAMTLLGDSLVGIRYAENDTAVFLFPAGEPGFLHPDFRQQPVADFIRKQSKPIYMTNQAWRSQGLGYGWSWDDYSDAYSAERSAFPVYGNCIRWIQERSGKPEADSTQFDQSVFIYSTPEVNYPVRFDPAPNSKTFLVTRSKDQNEFLVRQGSEPYAVLDVPYLTHGIETGLELLKDSLGKAIKSVDFPKAIIPERTIHARPLDSVLIPMMHRSNNFFAEQLLMMVSDTLLHSFSESEAIDSLQKTLLRGMPGNPRWVDGSGLSRYNLFSPSEFIFVLGRMRQIFGLQRLQTIFPVSGKGTLKSFNAGKNSVIAKTGSMSGVICLSGFVVNAKGKEFIFSILVNNHRSSAAGIRRLMGEMLGKL